MLRRAAALLAAILLALATAYADGSGGAAYREGQLDGHTAGAITFVNGDSFSLTDEAEKKLSTLLEHEIVRKGSTLGLFFDATGKVKDLKPIEDHGERPLPVRADPGKAKFEELVLLLKPGDIVLVDGNQKYAFNFYRNGQLVLDVLPLTGKKASSIFNLSRLRSLVKLEGEAVRDPTHEQPVPRANLPDPKPGEFVKIDGVVGYVLFKDETKIGLATTEGLREIPRAGIVNIERIELPIGPAPKPEPLVAGTEGDRVTIELDGGKLDFHAKTWTFRGSARHGIAGKILIGARLELEARGDGRLLTPQEEKKIVTAMGSELPAGISGFFTFEGVTYYLLRNPPGPELVIAMISDLPQRDSIPVEPIFAGVPESFEWPCRMLNPQDIHYQLVYEQKNVVASSDRRAQAAIVKAYEGGNQAHRDAALAAIASSQQPGFLPFLLYQLYIEQGAGEPIRRAFAVSGKVGEDWLLQLFKEKTTDAALGELAVPTGSDRVEKKRIGEPPRLVARAIELLSSVITDRSSDRGFGLALPYTRDHNEELRAAARALFIDHTERSIPFMLRRLRSEPEVVSILVEIDERKPGTLRDLCARHVKPDPEFERSLEGLEPADMRRKLVERLRRELSDVDSVDSDIVQARESIARVKALRVELTGLREDTRKAYVSAWLRAGAEADRNRRAELLRTAILLDPKEELPRHELARIFEDAARETLQGANIRAGPGVTFAQLRALAVGDVLTRAPETEATRAAAPEWIAVRHMDSRVGYVAPDLVRDQGDTVVVDKTARSRAVPSWLLLKARDLDPAAAREIDRSIAEVSAFQAEEAARGGDWEHAYKLYLDAFGRAPERYRLAVLGAYLRASPLVLGLAGIFAVMFVVSLVGTSKPAKKRPTAVVIARKEKAPAEPKKVPS